MCLIVREYGFSLCVVCVCGEMMSCYLVGRNAIGRDGLYTLTWKWIYIKRSICEMESKRVLCYKN